MIFVTGTSLLFVAAACLKFYFDPDSLYKLMHDFIYCFSVCQIKCNKVITFLNKSNPASSKTKIQYYINGKLHDDLNVTDIKESNVKFISLSLSYNGDKYPIHLKESNYNFYTVGVLDKQFFYYYLTNILYVNAPLETFTYELEMIDDDVNIQIINETKSIVLNEDGYQIV
jgi:hypothetical protein